MGYPKHMLLSFGGSLGTSGETWSCGIRMWSSGFEGLADAAAAEQGPEHVEEVDAKVRAYLTSTATYLNGWARHGWTKLNAIGPNGRYIGGTTGELLHTPEFNLNGGAPGPFQTSTVISLETGVQRGLAVSGRFFLPAVAQATDGTGAMQAQFAVEQATTAAAFIRALNNWTGIDTAVAPDVCVVSQGKQGAPGSYGPGLARPVTAVAVGRVQDTQRRRRAQLTERYQVQAL